MIGLCVDQPAAFWNTHHKGNLRAFELCATCPLPAAGRCGPHLRPVGLIVAGVAYDDQGHALRRCPKCGYPMRRQLGHRYGVCSRAACPDGNRRRKRQQDAATRALGRTRHKPALCQAEITALTLAGKPRAEIARQLQLSPRGVRAAQARWGLTGKALAQALAEHASTTTPTSRKAQ
ncbi:hypothetical protein KBX50_04700 [Micromonospora sp. C51]|uniref:hypothetical protein n=1 Tax=Micromonospora sp. C51 TaxID=2824879 RepID=UPI001B35AE97|nr:hypothetical protein [Micromonospora sp. C51]MBQ1047788.1 hypothetical protein [Micromonospora sp. C51]